MKIALLLSASLLLCCALPFPGAAQQIKSRDVTNRLSITSPSEAGEALRRRLRSVPAEPLGEQSREESVVRMQTFVLGLPDRCAGQGGAKTRWSGLSGLYETALSQRQRFREMARPMEFEGNRLYFRRDLYVTTKGLILHRFWDDRLDIGLYKRRFQPATTLLTGQVGGWCGVGEATNKSYIFSGGRQVFIGVRFKLNHIFHH